jgi:hypothetical protein
MDLGLEDRRKESAGQRGTAAGDREARGGARTGRHAAAGNKES